MRPAKIKPQIVKDINQKATDAVDAIQANQNLYEKYEQDYDKFLKTQITANGEKVEEISKLLGIFYFISKLKNNPNIANLYVPIKGNKNISQIDDKLTGSDTFTELGKVLYRWKAERDEDPLINNMINIDQNTSIAICNEIVESAIKDDDPESLIGALDVLMFAMYRMSSGNPINQNKKDELIEKLVKNYLDKVNHIAIGAIEKQVFSFKKSDGSQFNNAEIVEFYTAETPDDFTLKKNLETIKDKVKESLDKFKGKIDEISKNYKTQIDGIIKERPRQENKFIEEWKNNVDDGATLIDKLAEDQIIALNKEVETKVTEKSNYLSDLLKEAFSYIKAGKQLPTFLLDPADGYTELGLVHDKKANEDPLFDNGNPVDMLKNLRFILSEQRYIDQLKTAGFKVEETHEDIFVIDDKGQETNTGKKYYQLSRDDNSGDKIKEFLGSDTSKPRGVPNIYYKNGTNKPQQIYSREFLAVYQKALVEEIKSVSEKNKGNRVQINKCFFFTGEGKTHTIQRITNDIKFKKQADAALGKGSVEEMIVMDFNLQSDDLEEIKRKIRAEVDKNLGKKLSFVFQADEDPHTSADIKQFFYLDVYDFLTEECKLAVGTGLGTINTISISGTPKQKRFDHLVDKIVTSYENYNITDKNIFNKYWFGDARDGKQSNWLDKETGKKEIRTLENLFSAYSNIGELFSSPAKTDSAKSTSIEEIIGKNIKGIDDLKGGAPHRHIQYLMPDFSPNDSALLFAPDRLESLVKKILTDRKITTKDEFFVLLPPVADSVAKEMRVKAGDLSALKTEQKNYINLLEKKKIVKFVKDGGSWKLESVLEGSEEALDPKSDEEKATHGVPTERDCLSFYDKNTVVGGDYGKYSRDVTDVYIDDLSGRKFGTDDLAQWIARNRSMDLRKKDVVNGVKAKCNFHFCGTQESLNKIKENAANDAKLTKAQFDIINANETDLQKKLDEYKKITNSIKPANDNDLTPLKKITERLFRVKFTQDEINKIIEILDEYAEEKSVLNNPFSKSGAVSSTLLSDICAIKEKKIDNDDKKLTLNTYAKEYVEAQRAKKLKLEKKDNIKADLSLFKKSTKDPLSLKLELYSNSSSGKGKTINDFSLKDVFSLNQIWIGTTNTFRNKRIELLQKQFLPTEIKISPNFTIVDLLQSIDSKYSRRKIKDAIHLNDLDKFLNKKLDSIDLDAKTFVEKLKKVIKNLSKDKEDKADKKENWRLEDALLEMENNLFIIKNVKIFSPEKGDVNIKIELKIKNIYYERNIYRLAQKKAKKIEEKFSMKFALEKELEEIKALYKKDIKENFSEEYNNLNPERKKFDFALENHKKVSEKLKECIKALKKDINAFKKRGEDTYKEKASKYLPNSHTKKINPGDMKLYCDNLNYEVNEIDSLDLGSINEVNLKDDNKLLFEKDEHEEDKDFLVKKLLLSIDKEAQRNLIISIKSLKNNSEELKINVDKNCDVLINLGEEEILTKIKNFKPIKKESEEISAASEGMLSEKLAKKREKTEINNKIQLYYVKGGSNRDSCFIGRTDDAIPHLIIQSGDDKKTQVVDCAISKTCYGDTLKYNASMEDELKKCINIGYDASKKLKSVLKIAESSRELKTFIKSPNSIPIKKQNNFVNSLERLDDKDGNHLVKLIFVFDRDVFGEVGIPEDAPKIRYVDINGTGNFGERSLKLKFSLSEDGKMNYEGVFCKEEVAGDKIEFNKIEISSLNLEETNLLNKMKVVAIQQSVGLNDAKDTKVTLESAIYFDGSSDKKTDFNQDKDLEISNELSGIIKDLDFKVKPNSLVKHPEGLKLLQKSKIAVV